MKSKDELNELKNETPEAVVEKPDKCQHKGIHNSTCIYTKANKPPLKTQINNLKVQLKDLNIAADFEMDELKESNDLLNEKIYDLEAQLEKANKVIGNALCNHEQYGYLTNGTVKEIESFLSTNEVK